MNKMTDVFSPRNLTIEATAEKAFKMAQGASEDKTRKGEKMNFIKQNYY